MQTRTPSVFTLSVPNLRFPINAQPLRVPTSQLLIISRTRESTLLIIPQQTSSSYLISTITLSAPFDAEKVVSLAEGTTHLDCHLAEVGHGLCGQSAIGIACWIRVGVAAGVAVREGSIGDADFLWNGWFGVAESAIQVQSIASTTLGGVVSEAIE